MKLLTTLALSTLAFTTLSAETTMCFKENHTSMTTIEKTTLDGGLCSSKKSVIDMKKDGWTVDDIKIDGNNYIYVFKKETTINNVNIEALESKILKRLEDNKKEEQRIAKVQLQQRKSRSGKKIYTSKCANCHGEKGEELYGTSRAINQLNLIDFTTTMRDYGLGTYDRGQAIIMRPYQLTANDTKNVYVYLQSLKTPKKEEAKK